MLKEREIKDCKMKIDNLKQAMLHHSNEKINIIKLETALLRLESLINTTNQLKTLKQL